MKQKSGRKLLSFLLTLAMVVGLMPGMSLTAYAADGVAIGNGGYPYGTNMTSSITFIVDVAASSSGEYQWYVSDSSDGNYSTVADISGSFEANADSFETTFTPIDGKWYKCRINNEAQCETQPVMAKNANSRWYISNGTMAYSFFGSNTQFDVIGQINGTWVTQTSYDKYWNFYTSTDATPAPLKVDGTRPSSSATLKSAKASFSPSNSHVVNFEAKIGENEHAFAFGCDVKIRDNDEAPTTAIIASRTDSVKQMQLVDTDNLETAADTDPAMVVKYTTIPTHFWIGQWTPRYYYATNDKTTSTYYNDDYCSWNDAGVCYQYQGGDSGMTVSWTNRNGGDTIGFSFALGSVAETGAVTGKIDYSDEQIESLKANTTYVITVLDQDGNPTSETYTITSNSNGCIPLAGTDDNSNAYDLIGKLIQIGVKDSLSDPMEMDIAPRPDTEDPSQSGGDIYEKPEDVKENEVFVTENSITIKPQTDIGKRQQYRLYNSVGEEIAGQNWQSLGSDGTITFTGLSPNTSYLVKAFIPATQTAPKSLPSQGATISTFGTITVTKPTPTELTYNKELHSFPITVDPSDATVTYSTGENVNYNSEVPSFTDAGEYTVYYRVLKENYTNVYGSFHVKINKATNPTTVSESTSVDSGGKTVDLSANVTRNGATGAVSYTISGEANGCTVDSNGILTSGSTAGSVTVKVTVAEDTNYQVLPEKTITVTINEKLTQTITASDVTATYGDTGKKVEATTDGNGTISYAVKDGSADYIDVNTSTGALTIKKAGTATVIVTAAETATYAQATKEVTVTINKANAVDATVTANSRTYDGTDKPLVNVDNSTLVGGTMQYALGQNAATAPTDGWSTSIPAGTKAGTYYVWYKVIGDENHNNTTPACIEVAIDPDPGSLETAVVQEQGAPEISSGNIESVAQNLITKQEEDKGVRVWLEESAISEGAAGGDAQPVKRVASSIGANANITWLDLTLFKKVAGEDKEEIHTTSVPVKLIITIPSDLKALGDYFYLLRSHDNNVDIIASGSGDTLEGESNLFSTYAIAYTTKKTGSTETATIITEPQKKNLTYNGSEQELVTTGVAANGALLYAIGSDANVAPSSGYKTTIPTGTAAGDYYVWYKVVGDATHNDSEAKCIQVTIKRKSTPAATGSSTYDVTFSVVNGSWDDGERENKTFSSITSLSPSQIPSVGNKPDEGYMAGSWNKTPSTSISKNTTYIYTYAEKPLPTITKAPEGKDLTETGDEQELITPGTATGGTMEYALGSSEGSYTTSIPKATDAGTYYVWYKVVGDEEHRSTDPTSIEITIKENTKPAAVVTKAPERKDLTDTGEEQELVSAGEASGGTMEYALSITKPTSWSSSIPTATKAGTYYVWYRAKGDVDHSNSTPERIVVTVKYGANTLVYNGEEQNLVIPGSAEGGTMVYALGTDDVNPPEGTWSETVPTGKDVGPYYVWYKVIGDENHNDTEPLCIKVTIVPDSEVELFEELIDTLPEDVTRDDEELVEALRTLYDDLDADQKKQIPEEDVKKLEDAEKKLEELKAEDQAMADAVSALIDQLPEIDEIKPENKTAVDAVQKQYDALTDKQKELIPKEKREKLEALKAALAGPSAEDLAISERFTAAVNAVPGNKAGEGKGLVDQATEIYLTMTDAQKAIVKQETYDLYDEELAAFKAGRKFRSGDGYYRVLSNGDVTYHHHADKDITGVLVPNQVKKGKFFFKVIRVSDIAFRECNQLRWVIISKNVYVLGEKVFSKTPNLIKVRVLGTGFKSGKVTDAFVRDGKLTVKVPASKVDEYRELFTDEGGLDGTVIAA